LLVLLTKADKLNRNQQARALAQAQTALAEMATDASDISVSLFSALSRQGLGDAALTLRQWQQSPGPAPEADSAST
jgi:GTP-binding protein